LSIPNVTKFASDRLCCEINLICALVLAKSFGEQWQVVCQARVVL